MPPLRCLQLRNLLLRYISTSHSLSSFTKPYHRLLHTPSFSTHVTSNPQTLKPHSLSTFPFYRQISTTNLTAQEQKDQDNQKDNDFIAQSISKELSEETEPNSSSAPDSVAQRLSLHFSHVSPTKELVLSTLNISPDAGRTVLGFYYWLDQNPNFSHDDETVSYFMDYFGRRKDFKAIHELLSSEKDKGVFGAKTLECVIDRFVRAGRPVQAVGFFETMERDYGLKRDRESMKLVVEKLCEKGYANYAEKMVKNLATEFFPDEHVCDMLIKGWCVDGKLDEAKRLAGEMYRGGFEIGPVAYNAMLDCVCKLCRERDPFQMSSEVEKVLVDMDYYGVPRNVETFNVLIRNLCKVRKTEDAMKLFHRMGEWGCYPNEETFLVLIRSLYQAARVGEGDEMIDRMKSAGYTLSKKDYYGFLKILCGIERVNHALSVFKKMKADGCEPGIKTYDILMGKLCAHNRLDRANVLFNEALNRGVPVEPKAYQIDPRFIKKKAKAKEKEKRRETFPEKMARKRRKLKKIRLSFVKKPKKMMRRAF